MPNFGCIPNIFTSLGSVVICHEDKIIGIMNSRRCGGGDKKRKGKEKSQNTGTKEPRREGRDEDPGVWIGIGAAPSPQVVVLPAQLSLTKEGTQPTKSAFALSFSFFSPSFVDVGDHHEPIDPLALLLLLELVLLLPLLLPELTWPPLSVILASSTQARLEISMNITR